MIRFTKMQGAGNDYIYIDCFRDPIPERPDQLSRDISDRHFGVGADGLILILPSQRADVQMRMFNADGSEAEMCGNGIRCLAKYVYDHDLCRQTTLQVETQRGVLTLELRVREERVDQVRVDMGEPILSPREVPAKFVGESVVDRPLVVDGRELAVTAVSMGNPHCVVFTPEVTDADVLGLGPQIERHDQFPAGTNVEFVEVRSRTEVFQRTWERGSGETLACGTGACAVCVAGVLTGRTERRVGVQLRGGKLEVEWNEDRGNVYMTGPAAEVFSGEWPQS